MSSHRNGPFPLTARTGLRRPDWVIIQQISSVIPSCSQAWAKGPSLPGRQGLVMLFLVFEKQESGLAVIRVAIVITVGEVRPDFPQVACSDRLIAHRTEGLPVGGVPFTNTNLMWRLPMRSRTRYRTGGRHWGEERRGDFCRPDCPCSALRFPLESKCTFHLLCALRRCCRQRS